MIFLNLISTIISVSFVEYMMHRFYLHIKTHSHITHHHKVFNSNTQSFYKEDSTLKDIASSIGYLLTMSILSALIIFPFLIFFKQSLLVSFFSIILYIIWTEILHYLFHTNYRGLFAHKYLYKALEKHHIIHHSIYTSNFGIGSTQIDYILNTKFKSK